MFILVVLRIYFYFSGISKYTDGTKIRLKGRVNTEPIVYSNSVFINISGYKFYLDKYPEVGYGDYIIVEGIINGKKLSKVKVINIDENKSKVFLLKEKFINIFNKSVTLPHSALLSGLVLGSKTGISKDFWEDLKESGTAHVVVASGMNVTLISKFILGILVIFLPRRKSIPLAIIGIYFYSILCGFDAPIVRAAIMGSLAFVAQELGRLYYAWRSLFISAFFMLIIWPNWIIDIGFILSFIATLSLILFEKRIVHYFSFLPNILKESISTSISAQIGVAPIIYFSFGQFNLLSPLINALVLWTVPIITIIGMVGGVVGLIYLPIGRIILLLSYPFSSWFIFIIHMFS